MRRYLFLSLAVMLLLSAGACKQKNIESSDQQNVEKAGQTSGTDKKDVGLVAFIKKQKLVNFQSTTIGNAFDSYKYLAKKEWRVEQQKSGPFTIDFIGWFEPLTDKDVKDGITGRGLDVTFVVEPNGSFYVFMVSLLEAKSDGKAYRNQITDSASILAKIYGNKEISL